MTRKSQSALTHDDMLAELDELISASALAETAAMMRTRRMREFRARWVERENHRKPAD